MRHGVKLSKLGRGRNHRRAMLRNLATSVLEQGLHDEQMERHVVTTLPKAKAVRGLVERLITYGKKGDLSAKRQARRFVKNKEAFKGLFETLGERYKEREGGYTRILKLSSRRHGDNAEMAIIALVEDEIKKKLKKKVSKAKKKVQTASAAVETAPVKEEQVENTEEVKTTKAATKKVPKATAEKAQAEGNEKVAEVKEEKPQAAEKAKAKKAEPIANAEPKKDAKAETKPEDSDKKE
ncbi:MAG: 50S ribosomal protein L17 [Fibrobacteria bacterium]|nr:50S ribosomal protein L17 [Fibrobacteria bacterium]